MAKVRLDRFLANAGLGTRTEVKKYIKEANITVNHQVAKKPEEKVNPDSDRICFNNQPVLYQQYGYYMLHKPAGYLTATKDGKEKTVMELLGDVPVPGYFPVGRLDKDTEGLLLITNDGVLAHNLLAPGKHVDKTYYVRVAGKLTTADAALFLAGVDIGDEKKTKPARLKLICSDTAVSEAELTIQEGRYHQIKRMFAAAGKKVIYLKRLSMGSLVLDPTLKKGTARPLTEEEIKELQKR